mmetsp:Transcript_33620/g.78573  ORF Transcript_33620/g.78573 Transcript_33620/m.78573 type:complete len:327 (-) Transcript_33620:101-1081(-)
MGLTCCSNSTPERSIQFDAAGQEPFALVSEGGVEKGGQKDVSDLSTPAAAKSTKATSSASSNGRKSSKGGESNGNDQRRSSKGSPLVGDGGSRAPKNSSDMGRTSSSASGSGRGRKREPDVVDSGTRVKAKPLDPPGIRDLHFLVRWGKPCEELQKAVADRGSTMGAFVEAVDAKTGNLALHIAAQNGHRLLVAFLLKHGAKVDAMNFKGNTALHMSVEYDLYFVSKCLMEFSANPTLKNTDGHAALHGINGEKLGKEAWDSPMTILGDVSDNAEEVNFAFKSLEQEASKALLDKATLVRIGLRKRKDCPTHWDRNRFKALLDSVA